MDASEDLKKLIDATNQWTVKTRAGRLLSSIFGLIGLLSVASIGETIIELKGFLVNGVEFYRVWTGVLIEWVSHLTGWTIPQFGMDVWVAFALLILPFLRRYLRLSFAVSRLRPYFARSLYSAKSEDEKLLIQMFPALWSLTGKYGSTLLYLCGAFGLIVFSIAYPPGTKEVTSYRTGLAFALFYLVLTLVVLLKMRKHTLAEMHVTAMASFEKDAMQLLITAWSMPLFVAMIAAVSSAFLNE
ncbi:hypothetical protein [Marinobacter sp. V034]|uniref:hypothetical protein n=1 Tax=Marinobacter sp. V034 TaxID=3459610 RepID=UPI0040443FAF